MSPVVMATSLTGQPCHGNWTRGRLGSPKGKRSRAVDLTPQLVDALRSWGSVREAEAVVSGRTPSPWVPRP